MYLYSSRVIAIDYNCLYCRTRRALPLASNIRTRTFRTNILRSFAAKSSFITAILSCILFYLALSVFSLSSILSRNGMSSARQGDDINTGLSTRGGEEGNIVDISSSRRERRIDDASLLSLLGICI